jgi:hypothetical protein
LWTKSQNRWRQRAENEALKSRKNTVHDGTEAFDTLEVSCKPGCHHHAFQILKITFFPFSLYLFFSFTFLWAFLSHFIFLLTFNCTIQNVIKKNLNLHTKIYSKF